MSDENANMDPLFVERQRKRLVALREQLLGGQKQRVTNARTFGEDHWEEAQELEDDGQRLAESEIEDGLHDVEGRRLLAIDRALQKIDERTYGLSDVSGEPIPKARLEMVPEAFLTVQEEEEREKHSA
jgi:DnaK suppressor protein